MNPDQTAPKGKFSEFFAQIIALSGTLFVLIHYITVNNFSVMCVWVFLGLTNTKKQIKCLAQGHNIVTLPAERL